MTFHADGPTLDSLASLQTLAGSGLLALTTAVRAARGERHADRPAPLPPPIPRPAPANRPRGVYLDTDAPEGYVVILVYDRRGRRLSRAELLAEMYTAESFDAFLAWLELVDPEPARDDGDTRPAARRLPERLRLIG